MDSAQRRRAIAAALLAFGVPLLFEGCGSSVVVAEQKAASKTEDAGAIEGEGDASHVGFYVCGKSRCTDRQVDVAGGTFIGSACCRDFDRSACGLVLGPVCLELNQPGNPDDSCPGVPNTPIGDLPGCCRPGGKCGLLDTTVGFGCTDTFLPTVLSGDCVYH
ncbi:MAG TPA: hypothetical protein VHU80_03985 [Polyangiaceae bacterium]|nr:hypothetical protein [Polyangiaceae bacterium]